MERTAVMERTTKETKIRLSLCLDGTGKGDIHTGIGFFDHMLEGFARHGLFDLSLSVEGDLQVLALALSALIHLNNRRYGNCTGQSH